MRNNQISNIVKSLTLGTSGFAAKGRLLYLKPVGDTVRGFYFDSSGSSKAHFYFWMFYLPTCVPSATLYFNFGRRLGSPQRWNQDDSALKEKLSSLVNAELPFLRSLENITEVIAALKSGIAEHSATLDPCRTEALGYLLIKAGRTDEAGRLLGDLAVSLRHKQGWQEEIAHRVGGILAKLHADPKSALSELSRFEEITLQNLKL